MYFITKGTTCVHYIGTIICLHNLHYLKSDFDDINKNIYNKNKIYICKLVSDMINLTDRKIHVSLKHCHRFPKK